MRLAMREWSRSHQRCEAQRLAMRRIPAGVHIAGVRRRFLILDLEHDVGARDTFAGAFELGLGGGVEVVRSQTARRGGS